MNIAEADSLYEHEMRARRHVRIRRAKQVLRHLPRKATLHRWPILKWFAEAARKRPHLWSFRVREVSVALYIGFVIAFQPLVGIQFFLAFAAAWILRANLPVIFGTQLVTNLATMWAIYPILAFIGDRIIEFLRLEIIESKIGHAALAMSTGGLVAGLAIAFLLDMAYRLAFWHAKRRPVNIKRILKK